MKHLTIIALIITFYHLSFGQNPYFPQRDSETTNWQYLDVNGKIVLIIDLTEIEDLSPFSEGIAAAQDAKTHLWGYINNAGKWQIKPIFEVANDFKDGYAIVTNKCKTDCNKSEEGLLNDHIGSIIDKKGKIVFTDNSQDETPYKRYFMDQNLGSGLFSVIFGYGFNDMKNLINLKGEILCDTYSIFSGLGDIIFDDEMQAYRCKNKYYNLKGEMILDLSNYTYIHSFSNGYTWVSAEIGEDEENLVSYNILLDKKGKEIARFESNSFNLPSPVIEGMFTFTNENADIYQYNLKTKEIILKELSEIEKNYEFTIGKIEKNGCRFFYSEVDEIKKLMGFINAKEEVFYKN